MRAGEWTRLVATPKILVGNVFSGYDVQAISPARLSEIISRIALYCAASFRFRLDMAQPART
jgi:hypothetical protein